ncbi:carboxymuconolactone decarboxylase family protein [Dermatobacter hominis]|uniref:carboxymuconolactone decarboxylase family protein n=1 Tax=Dermatobacter hominis TaxID=2884263 RepID=UPI001D10236F|nr:carboxymuconolactone decarboxylase family protein [Dermatobacter hominis]UDY35553.1 carboxymuconolactone decarboxylase family protein [Dermatobacter hominis]
MAEPSDTPASATGPSAAGPEPSARRRRGLERMGEVYSFEVSDGPGDFFGYTVEHLFGDVWEREGLSLRDRRLLLIGLMVAEGLDGTLGIQLDSSLVKGDLTADDLREIVIFLSHYAGWPKGAGLNSMVETSIARYEKAQRRLAEADGAAEEV